MVVVFAGEECLKLPALKLAGHPLRFRRQLCLKRFVSLVARNVRKVAEIGGSLLKIENRLHKIADLRQLLQGVLRSRRIVP